MKAAAVTLVSVVGAMLALTGAPTSAAPTRPVRGAVVLEPRDEAALARFIASVSDRRSPSYGQYLRPGEFGTRFGPTIATIRRVADALRARGLQVGTASRSRMLVRFSGTPKNVADAALVDSLPQLSIAAVVGLGATTLAHPLVLHPLPSQVARHPAARAVQFGHPAGSPRACPAARTAGVGADGLTDDQIAHLGFSRWSQHLLNRRTKSSLRGRSRSRCCCCV